MGNITNFNKAHLLLLILILAVGQPVLSSGENCVSKIIRPTDKLLFGQISSFITDYDYDNVFTDDFLRAGGWRENDGHKWFDKEYNELEYFEYNQFICNVDSTIIIDYYPIYVQQDDVVIVIDADPRSKNDHAISDCELATYSIIEGNRKFIFNSLPNGFTKTKEVIKLPIRDLFNNEQSFHDCFMNMSYFTWTFIVRGGHIKQAYLRYVCGDSGCYPLYDLINHTNVVTNVRCDRRDR